MVVYMPFFTGSYGHTVKKYNSLGDLVQVLGTPGKKGSSLNPLQFDNPAELYVEDTGDIYIVDGDGGLNNRLIKLSQGKCGLILYTIIRFMFFRLDLIFGIIL